LPLCSSAKSFQIYPSKLTEWCKYFINLFRQFPFVSQGAEEQSPTISGVTDRVWDVNRSPSKKVYLSYISVLSVFLVLSRWLYFFYFWKFFGVFPLIFGFSVDIVHIWIHYHFSILLSVSW